MDSILDTVKKFLEIELSYIGFDTSIILGINSAILALNQLGVGPVGGFVVTGPTETWDTFLTDFTNVESAKAYICMKAKLMFDPPSSSFVLDAYNRQLEEIEWRLRTQVEENTG